MRKEIFRSVRTISLISYMSKIKSKVILRRLQPIAEYILLEE